MFSVPGVGPQQGAMTAVAGGAHDFSGDHHGNAAAAAARAAAAAAAGLAGGYAQPTMGLYAIQQGIGGFTLDAWGNPTHAGAAGGGDPYAAFAASPAFAAAAANQAAMAAAGSGYLLSPTGAPAAAAAAAAAGSPTSSVSLQVGSGGCAKSNLRCLGMGWAGWMDCVLMRRAAGFRQERRTTAARPLACLSSSHYTTNHNPLLFTTQNSHHPKLHTTPNFTPPKKFTPNFPQDDVRTIFVSGFPPDVRDRELHNLLRYLPGYEACQMNWKTGQSQVRRLPLPLSACLLLSHHLPSVCGRPTHLLGFESGAVLGGSSVSRRLWILQGLAVVRQPCRPPHAPTLNLLNPTDPLPPPTPTRSSRASRGLRSSPRPRRRASPSAWFRGPSLTSRPR
jgi:hypothetical protein